MPGQALKLQREILSQKKRKEKRKTNKPKVKERCYFLFVFVFLFFKTGFLCSFGACPGTPSVYQASLKLTEIYLSLPSKC